MRIKKFNWLGLVVLALQPFFAGMAVSGGVAHAQEIHKIELGNVEPGVAGQLNSIAFSGATAGAWVGLISSESLGTTPLGCGFLDLASPIIGVEYVRADENGNGVFVFDVPPEMAGRTTFFQAFQAFDAGNTECKRPTTSIVAVGWEPDPVDDPEGRVNTL